MSEVLVFAGGMLITPTLELQGDIAVKNGRIEEIRQNKKPLPGEQIVDCTGLYVGPGFVDIHVHGGAGHDFVSENPQEIASGVDYHLSQGTTSIVPSALSIPFNQLSTSIDAARQAAQYCKGDILGYHVEGIYLDKTYRGGHLQKYVHNPEPDEYLPLIEKQGDFICEWTLAPELPGALGLITACRKGGIVTSAGHTQASYEQMSEAIEAGLTHSTHFACVMSSLQFKALRNSPGKGFAPGVVETILLHDGITTEVIADGFHLHPAVIRLAIKCKGPHHVCLISDAMKGVGLPDGEYIIGGQNCLVKEGIAIIKDRPEVIASSVTPLVGMLRFAHKRVGLTLSDAWTMASLTPARVIGVECHKGSIAPGKDADIVLLDKNLSIKGVYARGSKIAVF